MARWVFHVFCAVYAFASFTIIEAFQITKKISAPKPSMFNLRMILDQTGNLMTLSRFMIEATRSNPDHADFESSMISIQLACKSIANAVAREGIVDLAGVNANLDSKGKKLSQYDYASYVLKNALRFTGKIGILEPKEEDDNAIIVEVW